MFGEWLRAGPPPVKHKEKQIGLRWREERSQDGGAEGTVPVEGIQAEDISGKNHGDRVEDIPNKSPNSVETVDMRSRERPTPMDEVYARPSIHMGRAEGSASKVGAGPEKCTDRPEGVGASACSHSVSLIGLKRKCRAGKKDSEDEVDMGQLKRPKGAMEDGSSNLKTKEASLGRPPLGP